VNLTLYEFMNGMFNIFSYLLLAGVFVQIVLSFRAKRAFALILPALSFACSLYWMSGPPEWQQQNSAPPQTIAVPYWFMTAALLITPVICTFVKRRKKNKK